MDSSLGLGSVVDPESTLLSAWVSTPNLIAVAQTLRAEISRTNRAPLVPTVKIIEKRHCQLGYL